jgi:hypothetical protein
MQRGPRACPRPHVVGKAGGPAGDSRKLYPFEQRRNNSETNLHRSRKGANGKREVVRLRFCAARKAFSGLRRRRGRVKGADRSNRPRPRATSARGGIARGFFLAIESYGRESHERSDERSGFDTANRIEKNPRGELHRRLHRENARLRFERAASRPAEPD